MLHLPEISLYETSEMVQNVPDTALLRESPTQLNVITTLNHLYQNTVCQRNNWPLHRGVCQLVDPKSLTVMDDVLFRWCQRYLYPVRHICGILGGLHPSQTRDFQHFLLSRAIFEVLLVPKVIGGTVSHYRDLSVLRISKVDASNPYNIRNPTLHKIFLKKAAELKRDPREDELQGYIVTQFSPHATGSPVTDCVAQTFTINTLQKDRDWDPSRPCGLGYTDEIPVHFFPEILNACVADACTQ